MGVNQDLWGFENEMKCSNEMSQLQMQTNRKWMLHMIQTENERRKDMKEEKGKERGNRYEGS